MIIFEGKSYDEEEFLTIYHNQKILENDAKERRTNMEKALLEAYGDKIDEDKLSKQFKVGRYTVNIKRNITYKLGQRGWDIIFSMPENQRPVEIKYSHTKAKNFPSIIMEEIPNETKPTFTVTYE